MSEHNIKLWEELGTDTPIEWWNQNREKLNEVIRMANRWQMYYRQDKYFGELVLAKVQSVINWDIEHSNHDLSDWQIDLLQEIHDHVSEVMEQS